jgi:hypothetical protein
MTNNPILEELYAAREQLLADAGGDAHKYLEGVRERERASGRLLTAEEQRTIRCNGAKTSGVSEAENLSSPPADR